MLWRTEGESGVEGECAEMRAVAQNETAGYYIYGTNAPLCVPGPDGEPLEQQPKPPSTPSPLFDPCAWARVGAWFARQDVQEALHAIQVRRAACSCRAPVWADEWAGRRVTLSVDHPASPLQPGEDARPWQECDARAITYSLDSLLTSMVPVHEQLVKAGEAAWSGMGAAAAAAANRTPPLLTLLCPTTCPPRPAGTGVQRGLGRDRAHPVVPLMGGDAWPAHRRRIAALGGHQHGPGGSAAGAGSGKERGEAVLG